MDRWKKLKEWLAAGTAVCVLELEAAEVKDAPDSSGLWWYWCDGCWNYVKLCGGGRYSVASKSRHWVKADKPTFTPKEVSDEPPPKMVYGIWRSDGTPYGGARWFEVDHVLEAKAGMPGHVFRLVPNTHQNMDEARKLLGIRDE